MELKKRVEEALNRQISHEFTSAYLYLSISAYFESLNLRGFAHWMKKQAQEELGHGMKIYEYLISRNSCPEFYPIENPKSSFKSVIEAVESALEHERKVTAQINELSAAASSEKDTATQVFLQWFISEQVEEEENALNLYLDVKKFGDSKDALLILDRELAGRK